MSRHRNALFILLALLKRLFFHETTANTKSTAYRPHATEKTIAKKVTKCVG